MPDLSCSPDDHGRVIAEVLRAHRFDDSSHFDEIFCHEAEDSPMVGMKRGPNAQADWDEWVDHVAPVLAKAVHGA